MIGSVSWARSPSRAYQGVLVGDALEDVPLLVDARSRLLERGADEGAPPACARTRARVSPIQVRCGRCCCLHVRGDVGLGTERGSQVRPVPFLQGSIPF